MVRFCCFSFLFILICTWTFAVTPKLGPTGLMVEFLRNPAVGVVNDPSPGFSWIDMDSKGDHQKSYQVLVSSSRQKIDSGDADVWNSGQVISGQSVSVKYASQPLKPNTPYFWRMKIWNSRSTSGMNSEIQKFNTGSFAIIPRTSTFRYLSLQI